MIRLRLLVSPRAERLICNTAIGIAGLVLLAWYAALFADAMGGRL